MPRVSTPALDRRSGRSIPKSQLRASNLRFGGLRRFRRERSPQPRPSGSPARRTRRNRRCRNRRSTIPMRRPVEAPPDSRTSIRCPGCVCTTSSCNIRMSCSAFDPFVTVTTTGANEPEGAPVWERTVRRPSTSSGPALPRLAGTGRWFARSESSVARDRKNLRAWDCSIPTGHSEGHSRLRIHR